MSVSTACRWSVACERERGRREKERLCQNGENAETVLGLYSTICIFLVLKGHSVFLISIQHQHAQRGEISQVWCSGMQGIYVQLTGG